MASSPILSPSNLLPQMNESFIAESLRRAALPSPSVSSSEVIKSGVWFIILTISSAVCERTDPICGGNAGVEPS